MKKLITLFAISITGLQLTYGQYSHPHILAGPGDKDVILEKINHQPWAQKAFDEMLKRVEPYVKRHQKDPEWILSRYLMNRVPGKRYTHFYSDANGTALVRYDGDAPYPTVRVSPHKRPPITVDNYSYKMPAIEYLVPYDTSMLMRLQSTAPGGEWKRVDPQSFVGAINGRINDLVLDASIIYWLTGKKEFAVFAADILSQWARGASYQQPIEGPCRTGFLHIQTLGDGHTVPMILAYDFLYNFLRQKKYETSYYETVFKKIANTMTFRGYWNNNWFAAQTPPMVFAALSLENEKLRDYYLDFYLNKDTINGACGHLALPSVVKKWLTPDGHWKEPGGYHNYPVGNLLLSALAMEKNGYPVFKNHPALFKASYVMLKYAFPNLKNPAFGDNGSRPSQSPSSLEIAILMAEKYHQRDLVDQLTSAMNVLISNRRYDRETSGYLGLLCFAPEIPVNKGSAYNWPRSGELGFARCYLQRNGMDPLHGLMYIVQGATYNHNHANGMAMELYGAGTVMGPDPGKGLTYEAPMHVNYYAQWAAHNTVVAGSRSASVPYFTGGGGAKKMGQIELAAMEPLPEKQAVSPYCSFTDTRYNDISTGTRQQRTMAIIRTSDTTGYYVDIYRSANKNDNEYIYHNIGDTLQLFTPGRKPVATTSSAFPMNKSPLDPPGFRSINNYRTTGEKTDGVIALFSLKKDPFKQTFMQVLLPGEQGREYYTGKAPHTRTAEPPYLTMPTPMLICRQEGEAWKRPFVAVYEPFAGKGNYQVTQVEIADRSQPGVMTALRIRNRNESEQLVLQSLNPEQIYQENDWTFCGNFGVINLRNNQPAWLYIGEGKTLSYKNYAIKIIQPHGSANLEIKENILEINCNAGTEVSIPAFAVKWVMLKTKTEECALDFTKTEHGITFTVPAVMQGVIRIVHDNE